MKGKYEHDTPTSSLSNFIKYTFAEVNGKDVEAEAAPWICGVEIQMGVTQKHIKPYHQTLL